MSWYEYLNNGGSKMESQRKIEKKSNVLLIVLGSIFGMLIVKIVFAVIF